MNIETKRFLISSTALLALFVSGCSTTKTNDETTQVTTTEVSKEETTQATTQTVAEQKKDPALTFDWNATVAPVKKFEKEYIDFEGNRVKKFSHGLADASIQLEERKKKITDKKVLEALKLVDAVFVNQGNFNEILNAVGVSNQEELYNKIWNDYMVPYLQQSRPEFTNDATFEYEGVTYPIKVYGPMKLKIGVNALGQSGAYTLLNYKVEGDMVYIDFEAPVSDDAAENLVAKKNTQYKEFIETLIKESEKIVKTDYSKNLLLRFLYSLAALDFKADGSLGVNGEQNYITKSRHYIAIKVDSNGKVSIDFENLLNLFQILPKLSNDVNKQKFKTNQ